MVYLLPASKASTHTLPFVTVIIAARNEEQNIKACIASLIQQHYPSTHFEIWIGNDGSTDHTAQILQECMAEYTSHQIHVLNIEQNHATLKGKTKVLRDLFEFAKGELVCIVDADVQVNPLWISGYVQTFNNTSIAAASGVTDVQSQNRLSDFQKVEWQESFLLLRAATYFNQSVSAVGNNMCIRKSVYQAVGGYDAIGFSVTEDLALSQAIEHKGYKHIQVFNAEHYAFTQPMLAWQEIIVQRLRWMKGFTHLPLPIMLLMSFLQTASLFLVLLFLFYPSLGFMMWLLFISLRMLKISFYTHRFKALPYKQIWNILFFDIYIVALGGIVLMKQFTPYAVRWKGRTY